MSAVADSFQREHIDVPLAGEPAPSILFPYDIRVIFRIDQGE